MTYIAQSLYGEAARKHAADTTILGANMPQISACVDKLELVCSSFSDKGADWCEFRAYDSQGKLIGKKYQDGY